jgi:hypothetical protein
MEMNDLDEWISSLLPTHGASSKAGRGVWAEVEVDIKEPWGVY